MRIEYAQNEPVDAAELQRLLKQTSWANNRELDAIEYMLAHTPLMVTARHNGTLVGFARSLTDFVYRGLIDDVVVDEAYRGHGIGAQLIAYLGQALAGVEEVFLGCDAGVVPFYQQQGYTVADHPYMKRP